jgi:hypothetical protein
MAGKRSRHGASGADKTDRDRYRESLRRCRRQAEAAWAEQLAFLREVLAPDYDRSTRSQLYACESAVDYDFRRNVRQA